MLILADTGILLRLLDRTDPQHSIIRQALRVIRQRSDRCVMSAQNAAAFWNLCTRPVAARGGLGLTVSETERRLRVLERLFTVLPDSASTYMHWRTLVMSHGVMGTQAHDARLVAFMMGHGLTQLLTLNPADFARYPTVAPTTPAAFVASSP
jgi:predicted nucleic acid-binding protein